VPVRPPVPRPPVPRHASAEDPPQPQRRGFPGQSESRGEGSRGRGPTRVIQELLEQLLLRGEAGGTSGGMLIAGLRMAAQETARHSVGALLHWRQELGLWRLTRNR